MKKRIIFQWLFIFSIITLVMFGCSSNETNDAENNDQATETTESEVSFPLEITDSTGNSITLDAEPEKIISLIPSNTEILFALGLGDKIIAVTENDNYPEEVFELDTVGDYEINVEKIISLDPDLVLAHVSGKDMSFDAFEQLIDAGINVYFVSDAQNIEATYESIKEIGKVTGAVDAAENLIAEMKAQFEKIVAIAEEIPEEERKTVFFEITGEPEIYTAGTGTFFNELVELIHAENAANEIDGWAQIDPEAIVDLNPDVIITLYGKYTDDPVGEVLNRDGFSDVNAVKNEQVFDIDDDPISRPGPRLVDGAKELAEVVYPEYFTN